MICLSLETELNRIEIEIHSNNFMKTVNKIKSIRNSKYHPKKKKWTLPRNKKSIMKLENNFNEIAYKYNKYKLANLDEPELPNATQVMMKEVKNKKNLKKLYKKFNLDKLKYKPKKFQTIGILTALFFQYKYKGFLIGDTMGLGKTFQAIAVANGLKQQNKANKILALVPKQVKYQWGHEIEKFTNMSYKVIDGYNREKRLECYEDDVDFYIANPSLLLSDVDYKNILDINPKMIISDEIHYFKNHDAQRSEKLKQLRKDLDGEPYKLGLTGTPMENNPTDIHSIFEFLYPEMVESKTKFNKKYTLYKKKRNSNGGFYTQKVGNKNLFNMKKRFAKLFIRRKICDIEAELPKCDPKDIKIKTKKNQKHYHKVIENQIENINKKQNKLLNDGDDKKIEEAELDEQILGMKNIQRMIADDLRLLNKSDSKLVSKMIGDNEFNMSYKTKNTLKLINKILNQDDKNNIVIFSKFARMVKILKEDILNNDLSKEVAILHGDIKEKKRDKEIQNFKNNDDCRIIVMSDAGNAGINLTIGTHLINYDLPWNPSTYEQRNGRIRRLGSEWDRVYVYNMISKETIDEQIKSSIENKQELINLIIENTKSQEEAMKKIANYF